MSRYYGTPRIDLKQNLINHVGFVFDGSGSMGGREEDLIRVADDLIEFLKKESVDRDQETRVTMYIFGDETQAVCYDVDVLRTPSIKSFYSSNFGMTALVDASERAIRDMKQTATLYGDHAFLLYVMTDGGENASSASNKKLLPKTLAGLDENWTIAALVPDQNGREYVAEIGFHVENTLIWDATTTQGIQQAADQIKVATQNYYEGRTTGTRGTKNLFTPNVAALTTDVVQSVLEPLKAEDYWEFVVDNSGEVIRPAVQNRGRDYKTGKVFYALTKREEVQPKKQIMVRDKDGNIFHGDAARSILGLPRTYIKVEPAQHPNYDIFVQSTSVNRKLVGGTTTIVLN